MADDDAGATALSDRSVSDLLKQLSDQTATLVRQELDLAMAELSVKGRQAGIGVGMFGAAGLIGMFAVGALTACLVLLLATAVAGWLAALIVAAVYGAVAGVLAITGKGRVQRAVPPTPEQTVQTIKEDVALTRERVREGRR